MSDATAETPAPSGLEGSETYSFLGPTGTFTEAALAQVPEGHGV